MSPVELACVALIAVACSALPLYVGQKVGSIPYFSSLHIVSYLAFLGVTLKVVIFIFDPSLGFFARYTSDTFAYIDGLFFVFAFIVFIVIGYLIPSRKQILCTVRFDQSYAKKIRFKRFILPAAVLSVVFVTANLISSRGIAAIDADSLSVLNNQKHFDFNADGVGSTGALVKTFYTVPRILFIISVLLAVSSGLKRDLLISILIGILLVGVALVSGDRFELIRLAVYAGIASVIAGWRINFRSLFIVGTFGALIVTVAALMSNLREGEVLKSTDSSAFAKLAEQVVESTYFMDVNVPTMVINRMSDSDHLGGISYTWWTFGWIPRALWPEKPAVDLGIYLKRTILGENSHSGGGINVTGPGEAFINFGWLGMLVGLPLGLILRLLELKTLANKQSSLTLVIFYPAAVFLFNMACMQSSFSGIFTSMFAIVPLIIFTCYVLLGARKKSFSSQVRYV